MVISNAKKIFFVKSCHNLRDALGIFTLVKLVELEIVSCDKLEFDCLLLRDMECLQSIIINVKVKHYELDSCSILETLEISCETPRKVRVEVRLRPRNVEPNGQNGREDNYF